MLQWNSQAVLDPNNAIDWGHPLNRGRVGLWVLLQQKLTNNCLDLCYGQHAVRTGTRTRGTRTRVGPFVIADFNNTTTPTPDYYAAVLEQAIVTGTTGYSWAGWMYATSTSGAKYYFALHNNSTRSQTMQTASGQNRVEWRDSGTSTQITGGAPINSKWHHIAGSYDGTNTTLYVDGVVVSAPSARTWASQTFQHVSIARNGYTNSTMGAFSTDTFTVWNRPLSDSEIIAEYNAARLGYLVPNSPIRWGTTRRTFATSPGSLAPGAGSVAVAFAGSGAGAALAAASGSASVSFAGSGSGASLAEASGAASVTFAGAGGAAALAAGDGGAASAFTVAGVGESAAATSGTVSVAFAVSGDGSTAAAEAGSGSASASFSVAGTAAVTAATAGTSSATFAATGTGSSTAAAAGTAAVTTDAAGVGSAAASGTGATAVVFAVAGDGTAAATAGGSSSVAVTVAGAASALAGASGTANVAVGVSGFGAAVVAAAGSVSVAFAVDGYTSAIYPPNATGTWASTSPQNGDWSLDDPTSGAWGVDDAVGDWSTGGGSGNWTSRRTVTGTWGL